MKTIKFLKGAILLLALLCDFETNAQTPEKSALVLTNTANGEVNKIGKGKWVVVETKDGKVYKGHFKVQNSNELVIKKQIIPFSEVNYIKVPNVHGKILFGAPAYLSLSLFAIPRLSLFNVYFLYPIYIITPYLFRNEMFKLKWYSTAEIWKIAVMK